MFRVKAYDNGRSFDHRMELHALFLGQKPEFNLASTEVAVKAFFSHLCKSFVTDMQDDHQVVEAE